MSQQPGTISPAQLRPRRRWYFVALGVFLVCTAIGVGLFVWQIGKVADGVNLQELRTGPNKVRLTADKQKGIYATGKVDTTSLPTCLQDGPGRLKFGPVSAQETYTVDGTTWYVVGTVTATKTGTYTVICTSTGATEFAVGNRVGGLLLGGLGAVGLLFGLILLGAIAGGIIAIVVLVRRIGHKKRLLRPAMAAGGGPGGYAPAMMPPGGMPQQPPSGPPGGLPPWQPQSPQPGQPPQQARPPQPGQPPPAAPSPPQPGQPPAAVPGQPYGPPGQQGAEPEPPTVPGQRPPQPPPDGEPPQPTP